MATTRDLFDLSGKVALVTGGSRGLGLQIAEGLGDMGCKVAITARKADELAEAAKHLRARGIEVLTVANDLAKLAEIPAMVEQVVKGLGPVDILVNNATGWVQDTFTPAEQDAFGRALRPVTQASFERQFAVDAMAAALLIAEFARRHIERHGTWGRIIGLTSGGAQGFPSEVSYGAAKAAQENYTMSASVELADHGVTANMVHPPVTDTGWVTDDVREAVRRRSDLVHVATPDQVAEVIDFLASDAAALVTGNILSLR